MKDFDKWNESKKSLDMSDNFPIFHEREVWNSKLGINVGFEQNGVGEEHMRPVLIFKKFNTHVFWGIPLTRTKKDLSMYFSFGLNGSISTAILSQVRLIDSRRLCNMIGYMSNVDFKEIRKRFRNLAP